MVCFLEIQKRIAFDYETSGLRWWQQAESAGLAFTSKDPREERPRNFYVPFRHLTGQPQLTKELVIDAVRPLFENEKIEKIAHNIKFDEHFLHKDGLRIVGTRHDTMIAAYLYDENVLKGLKHRALVDLGDPDAFYHDELLSTEITRLAKFSGLSKTEYKNQMGYAGLDIWLCGMYAAHDTEMTWKLLELYEGNGTLDFYKRVYTTEMALTEVICDMERVGVPLDIPYLQKLHEHLLREQEQSEGAFFKAAGVEWFNLGSDDELRFYLQKGLRLPLTKTTKKHALSVDSDVLEGFVPAKPFLQHLIRWRDVSKKASTYTQSLIALCDSDGILHGEFQQVGTNTGRTSCKNPNLQNIPSDDPTRAEANGGLDPESIKRAFIIQREKDPYWGGTKLYRLFGDYSQVELRAMARYTGDERMVRTYLEDGDIHDETEMAVFGTKGDSRRLAKVINFGLCLSGHQRVLTKQDGYVPLRSIKDRHLVWDGVAWVSHDGLVCRGEQEVIFYDGIEATPEHEVYTREGTRAPLACVAANLGRIAIGDVGGVPVGYSDFDGRSWEAWTSLGCGSCVWCLQQEPVGACGEHPGQENDELYLPEGQVPRSEGAYLGATLRRYGAAVRAGYARLIEQLQRAGDQSAFRIARALHSLGTPAMAGVGFQGVGFGSQEQRRALRAGQYAVGFSFGEFEEQAQVFNMQGGASVVRGQSIRVPQRPSFLSELYAETSSGVPRSRKAVVYDLLNAGPRHRFCVEGKIVSNSYCLTPIGFARQTGVSEDAAQRHFDEFHAKFPGIPAFREGFWVKIQKQGNRFENLWGRTRRLPKLGSQDKWEKLRAQRQAIGSLIQGTAAELTKETLVRVWRWMRDEGLSSRLCQTVHDEIQTDGPVSEFAHVAANTKRLAENYPEFDPIPVVMDLEVATTHWAAKRSI